jgi:hypothetical protein
LDVARPLGASQAVVFMGEYTCLKR